VGRAACRVTREPRLRESALLSTSLSTERIHGPSRGRWLSGSWPNTTPLNDSPNSRAMDSQGFRLNDTHKVAPGSVGACIDAGMKPNLGFSTALFNADPYQQLSASLGNLDQLGRRWSHGGDVKVMLGEFCLMNFSCQHILKTYTKRMEADPDPTRKIMIRNEMHQVFSYYVNCATLPEITAYTLNEVTQMALYRQKKIGDFHSLLSTIEGECSLRHRECGTKAYFEAICFMGRCEPPGPAFTFQLNVYLAYARCLTHADARPEAPLPYIEQAMKCAVARAEPLDKYTDGKFIDLLLELGQKVCRKDSRLQTIIHRYEYEFWFNPSKEFVEQGRDRANLGHST